VSGKGGNMKSGSSIKKGSATAMAKFKKRSNNQPAVVATKSRKDHGPLNRKMV